MTNEAPERIWVDPTRVDHMGLSQCTAGGPKTGWNLGCTAPYVPETALTIAQARIAELEAALRRLRLASSDMLDGVAIHNQRHTPAIEGPVVSAFSAATQAARTALEAKP